MQFVAMYALGGIVLLGGLAWGATLVGVPFTWIGVGALVLIGAGLMGLAQVLRKQTQPKETVILSPTTRGPLPPLETQGAHKPIQAADDDSGA